MATTPEKEQKMPATATHQGDLDQVVELNRLFLRLLKARADKRQPCFGLSPQLARRLRAAAPVLVDGLAELPRALFSLNLDAARPAPVVAPAERRLDSATQSLQLTVLLSRPGRDFTGGELVLTEQRPRRQSRAEVVPLARGDAVIFPVRHRPVRGTRGCYRVSMRHGVSRVRSGRRHTLGIIFHDAA